MLDISQIALLTSIVVGAIQVFTYFRNNQDRVESKTAVYAKAEVVKNELDNIRHSIDEQLNKLSNTIESESLRINHIHDHINHNITSIAVIEEKLTAITKLDDKIDQILRQL